jgi:hypothetical protein
MLSFFTHLKVGHLFVGVPLTRAALLSKATQLRGMEPAGERLPQRPS